MAGDIGGNRTVKGKVRGVAYDDSQLSEEEARAAKMPLAPKAKVKAAGAGGALALVLVWIAGLLGVELPPEVASAITVLLTTAGGWIKRD